MCCGLLRPGHLARHPSLRSAGGSRARYAAWPDAASVYLGGTLGGRGQLIITNLRRSGGRQVLHFRFITFPCPVQ